MLEYGDRTTWPHSFASVALGFALRFPNPLSPHVVTADVLSRSLDPSTGKLRTTRLLLKRGSLPRWAPRGVIERAETWVVEVSECSVWEGELDVVNRNIDHTVIMEVVERQTMRALGPQETEVISSARITSSWGFFAVRRRIERFGLSRVHRQQPRTLSGVLNTIALVAPASPWREAMLDGRRFERPDEKEKLGGRVRKRLEVLRERARRRRSEIVEAMWRPPTAEQQQQQREAPHVEDEGEEDEEITHEEAEELANLEQEEREHFATQPPPLASADASFATTPPTPEPRAAEGWRERWLWWWRWTLPGIER